GLARRPGGDRRGGRPRFVGPVGPPGREAAHGPEGALAARPEKYLEPVRACAGMADESRADSEHADPETGPPRPVDHAHAQPGGDGVDHTKEDENGEIQWFDRVEFGGTPRGTREKRTEQRAADLEVACGAAVDEHQKRRGRGLDARRDRSD